MEIGIHNVKEVFVKMRKLKNNGEDFFIKSIIVYDDKHNRTEISLYSDYKDPLKFKAIGGRDSK